MAGDAEKAVSSVTGRFARGKAELAAVRRLARRKVGPGRLGREAGVFLISVTVGVLIVVGPSLVPGRRLDPESLLIGAALMYGFLAVCGLRIQRAVGREFASGVEIEVTAGAMLSLVRPNGAVRYDWGAFRDLLEDQGHFYLRFSERFGEVIPKRAFSTDEAKAAFRELASQRIAAARPA